MAKTNYILSTIAEILNPSGIIGLSALGKHVLYSYE